MRVMGVEAEKCRERIRELEDAQRKDAEEKAMLRSAVQELEAEVQFAEEHIKLRETKYKEDMEKYLENLMKLNEWEKKYTSLSNDFNTLKEEFASYQGKRENEVKELRAQLENSMPNGQIEEYKRLIDNKCEEKIKEVVDQNEDLAAQINELRSKLDGAQHEAFDSTKATGQRARYKFAGNATSTLNAPPCVQESTQKPSTNSEATQEIEELRATVTLHEELLKKTEAECFSLHSQ